MQRAICFRSALALALVSAAAAQSCSLNFTATLRNFNKAGAGANGNPDFGFLTEPADITDKKIVKPVLSSAHKPAYSPAGGFKTSTTHSAIDFNQWFNDASYMEEALIILDDGSDASGRRFGFSDSSFYPLDGLLLGANTSAAHNRYYTMEINLQLKYLAYNAPVMTFRTNCDLFVFVNGEVVVNLGGVHAIQSAQIVFHDLGLSDGLTYRVDIFLAQRHAAGNGNPVFDWTTNVDPGSGKRTAASCAVPVPGSDTGVNGTTLDALYPPVVAPPANGFPGVPGCNAIWGVAAGDSCDSIARKSGLDSAAVVSKLNPGLNCGALKPGQFVCTGTGGAPTATCGNRVYTTNGGDSCLTIRDAFGSNGIPIKFSVLQALNPDLNCGSTGQSALPAGTNVCLPVIPGASPTARRRLQGEQGLVYGGFQPGLMAMPDFDMEGLENWATPRAAEFRRTMLAAAGSSCIGGTFKVQATSCGISCSSAAMQAGLTVTQLTLLNPQLLDNASQTCKVTAGQTLCKGCTGNICGVSVTPALSDFLNFPDLNLLMCGLLADCGNYAYTEGVSGAQDEALHIIITKQSASTRAYTAAGGAQIAAYFDPQEGYAATNPGSELALSIFPSYYDKVTSVAKGGSAGLVSWSVAVALADNSTSATRVASSSNATTLTSSSGRRLLAWRLPKYVGSRRYRRRCAWPSSMVISRWRRIW